VCITATGNWVAKSVYDLSFWGIKNERGDYVGAVIVEDKLKCSSSLL